jgi:predicted acylesterase/phospholipase RssA
MQIPTPVLNPSGVLQHFVLCALVFFGANVGCAQHHRQCLPPRLLSPETTIDLNSTADTDQSRERNFLAASLARMKSAQPAESGPNGRHYNVLALSGGGSYGAFSAGLLNGWTAGGQRPQFDIVSGVSTGALIATYAFLGSRYDPALREFYTTTTTADIYRKRFKPAVLWSDSFVFSEPLKRMIEASISPQLLCEVAIAHAQGRRLFIGTTNVDTGRLVIWDMGAIASSGKPDSLALYRKIILASASPPGFFPPVHIDISVNGRNYTELHVDGGTTAQVFFRSSMVQIDPAEFSGGGRPLVGSCVYIIIAGKAFPDPKCVTDRAVKIAGNSLGALTYAQTRNDLIRIYTLSLLTGMDFRVATIPQDWPIQEDSMVFDQASMRSLYDRGYQWAVAGAAWADVPPVLDASQQSIPRAGTQFLAPHELRAPPLRSLSD